ncbi:hypothetical protein Tco_1101625 [Tanacetum coccineum]
MGRCGCGDSGGGDDGGGGGDAAETAGGGERRVAASGGGDRVDPAMRNTFGLRRNTRRKTFSAAVGRKRWRPEVAAGWRGREKWERMKMMYQRWRNYLIPAPSCFEPDAHTQPSKIQLSKMKAQFQDTLPQL